MQNKTAGSCRSVPLNRRNHSWSFVSVWVENISLRLIEKLWQAYFSSSPNVSNRKFAALLRPASAQLGNIQTLFSVSKGLAEEF